MLHITHADQSVLHYYLMELLIYQAADTRGLYLH